MWFKFQRVGIEGERHGETGRVVSRTPGATSLTVVPADFQRVRLLDPLLEHTTQQANDQSHLPLPGYSSAFRCLQGHSNLEFKYGDPGIFWPHVRKDVHYLNIQLFDNLTSSANFSQVRARGLITLTNRVLAI